MKTAFRQVSLATTAEAEEAVGWVLEKVFEQTPSVFTHPENSGPILSVYLGEKQRVTEAHRHAVQAGLEAVADCGLEVGAGQLEVKRLRREDWVDSWKRHFKPIDIQGKLLLKGEVRAESSDPRSGTELRDGPTCHHQVLSAPIGRPARDRTAPEFAGCRNRIGDPLDCGGEIGVSTGSGV